MKLIPAYYHFLILFLPLKLAEIAQNDDVSHRAALRDNLHLSRSAFWRVAGVFYGAKRGLFYLQFNTMKVKLIPLNFIIRG